MHTKEEASKMSKAKENYLVAVKIILRQGTRFLATHDIYGEWDIPGGRIRKDQFATPMEKILEEKIALELGNEVTYKLGSIVETIRVEREEYGRDGEVVRIFAVCYEAEYIGGEIELGDVHDKYEWIDLRSANLEEYRTKSGWVHRLAEYQQSVS